MTGGGTSMTGTAHNCRFCDKPLVGEKRGNRVYCNEDCSRADLKRKWREQNPKTALAAMKTGTIGEVNAMRVSIDLLTKGYQVFRAAFPAMPFDIVVVEDPLLKNSIEIHPSKRIKVTTGSKTVKGTLVHPVKPEKRADFDVLAVVTTTGDIFYDPEL